MIFYTLVSTKRVLAMLVLAGFLVTACNSDSKTRSATESSDSKDAEDEIDMDKVVADVCECIDEMEGALSSRSKKIFLKAAKSGDPQTSIQEQMEEYDQEEQLKIAEEFKQFENSDAQDCFKKLEKKYPEMKDAGKKKERELFEKVEEDCSEFAAALLKMGQKQSYGDDE
jgi:hypothetical protein